MTPGLEEVEVSNATLGVSITLSTSTRYLTLKAISIGPPSTVASSSVTLSPVSAAVAEIVTCPGVSSLPGLIFSRDSLYLWVFRTYWRRRREYPLHLRRPQFAHLAVLRPRSPAATKDWLAGP